MLSSHWRSHPSSPNKQSGFGLAQSVQVIGSGREGLPWSASLGLPTQIFLTCQKQSSSKAHREALVEWLFICWVEDLVDRSIRVAIKFGQIGGSGGSFFFNVELYRTNYIGNLFVKNHNAQSFDSWYITSLTSCLIFLLL